MARLVHAVAGRPVAASASPLLFLLTVARLEEAGVEGIALEHSRALRIEATAMEGVFEHMTEPPLAKGGLHGAVQTRLVQSPRPRSAATSSFRAKEGRWLSLTSPLKHLIGDWDCVDDAHALLSVNALRLQGIRFAPPARTGPAWWPWLVWPVVVRTVVPSFACVEAVARHVPLHMPGSTQAGAFISLRADVLWRQPARITFGGVREQAALGIDFDGEGEGL